MPTTDPITLTLAELAELAERWNKTPEQLLETSGLPMYFYFDGLVFDFNDKWHRANGDAVEARDLEAHQARLASIEIDLQRQSLHQRGLLKLTQWEAALSDDELRQLQAEVDRLNGEIVRLSARLKQRIEDRQRHVRNGLLRAAPRTLRDIAQHGSAPFPHFAFMPHTPAGGAADAPIADGAVVALEDGFPLKARLAQADLVISMLDVKAAEAASQ